MSDISKEHIQNLGAFATENYIQAWCFLFGRATL